MHAYIDPALRDVLTDPKQQAAHERIKLSADDLLHEIGKRIAIHIIACQIADELRGVKHPYHPLRAAATQAPGPHGSDIGGRPFAVSIVGRGYPYSRRPAKRKDKQ
jgi:hypothetical protein